MNPVKHLLIADDHPLFLDGIEMIFSQTEKYKIVARAGNGQEVLEQLQLQKIDIAILDINMPAPNGFDLCKIIHDKYPSCQIVMLSMYHDHQFVDEILRTGAKAYLLKNAGKEDIFAALDEIELGHLYVSKDIKRYSIDNTSQKQAEFLKSFSLTKRELEVVRHIVSGKNSQEIAEILNLSTYTINTHRKNILQKLGLKNSAALVKFAMTHQLD